MKRTAIVGAIALTCLLGASEVLAQVPASAYGRRPYVPYQPARPTMSPWFGLYNTNRGPLPNYYNYVIPQQQLQRTLQLQEDAIHQQNLEYQALQGDVSKFERAATIRPTGASATFLNYQKRFQTQRSYYGTR